MLILHAPQVEIRARALDVSSHSQRQRANKTAMAWELGPLGGSLNRRPNFRRNLC